MGEATGTAVQTLTWLLSGMAVATVGYVGIGSVLGEPPSDIENTVTRALTEPLALQPPQPTAASRPPNIARADHMAVSPAPARPVDSDPATEISAPKPILVAEAMAQKAASGWPTLPVDPMKAESVATPVPTPTQVAPRPRLIAHATHPQPRATQPIVTRAAVPGAESPSNAQHEAPETCLEPLRTAAHRTRIYFDSGSSAVGSKGRAAAIMLARMIRACPSAHVTVTGFTDPTGNPLANLSVSWQRARNVHDLLVAQGVPEARLTVRSHTEEHDETCEHYDVVDRRVEFIIR